MPETARSKPLEIWFQDEARVGQQGTLTRIWAERGTRPRAPRDTRYIWSYIFGAVCPERAEAAALIMPHADTQAMSAHLAEIAKTVASGAHALLILDGAGWHGSAELEVPDNITLLKLPPYSPELNPMENVWAYLRANKLAISVFDNYEQIVDRCCEAWNFFANDKTAITSITTRQWAKTVNDLRSMELLCKRQNRNHVNHYQTMGQNGQRLGPFLTARPCQKPPAKPLRFWQVFVTV